MMTTSPTSAPGLHPGDWAVSPLRRPLTRKLTAMSQAVSEFLHSGAAGCAPPPWHHAGEWLTATLALKDWVAVHSSQLTCIERGCLLDFNNVSSVAFVQYHQLMHQARCSAGPLEELLLHEFLESMV